MVTSLDPLRLYLLGTGIPKVAQWKYSKEPERVKEQCIHVLLPGTTECFASRDGVACTLTSSYKSSFASTSELVGPEAHGGDAIGGGGIFIGG